MPGKSDTNNTGRANTLGLSQQKLSKVLTTFDTPAHPINSRAGRVYARWPFREVAVNVTLVHPGGNAVEMQLACRNLSRGGIGLLHSSYIHVGSRIQVALPLPGGGTQPIDGQVVRCENRMGIVHEIGIAFDALVNLRKFIPRDLFEERLSFEQIDPADLAGTLLHIEPNSTDRRIVSHFLRESRVAVQAASTPSEAIELARSGHDVILCEYHLGDVTGSGLVQQLRSHGIDTPVIFSGSKLSEPARQDIRTAGAGAFIPKPFNQSLLQLHLAELLCIPDAERSELEQGSNTDDARKNQRLVELGDQLEVVATRSRPIDAYAVCIQLRQAAMAAGREDIATQADRMSVRLSHGEPMDQASGDLMGLASSCRPAA